MNAQRKQNMKNWLNTWLTPSLILGGIIAGAWATSEFKADSNTRMFESAAQKEKTRAHIDSDYNEVKNYQLMQEQKQMKAELDTAYAFVNAIFKEDREARRLDSLNNANAIKSRAQRDSLVKKQAQDIEDMRREQRITSNAVQLILSKLDTTR
jgi:hypothetical protein